MASAASTGPRLSEQSVRALFGDVIDHLRALLRLSWHRRETRCAAPSPAAPRGAPARGGSRAGRVGLLCR